MNSFLNSVQDIKGDKMEKEHEQLIDCTVHDCKHCNCEENKCKLRGIQVCNCGNEQGEKETTMCDSYDKKED